MPESNVTLHVYTAFVHSSSDYRDFWAFVNVVYRSISQHLCIAPRWFEFDFLELRGVCCVTVVASGKLEVALLLLFVLFMLDLT